MCEKSAKKPCRFGRIKPDGPPALRLAIPAGLVIATVIGIVLQSAPIFPHNTMNAWLRALLIGACVAPASIALVWMVVVDRSTIPGALPHPEHSVECTWYDQAAKDSFHFLLAGTGLGAALTSFWLPPMVSWTLIAVFALPQLRRERHLSQEKLATMLGVSRQTIISIEKERFDPSLPLAFQIAGAFDLRIEDIFTPDAPL